MHKYMTEWGGFDIPTELFLKTKWEMCVTNTGTERPVCPLPVPENWPFFKWLDEQEILAGKPNENV